MAEWLRRWTANPLCSARVGSNPILVAALVTLILPCYTATTLFKYFINTEKPPDSCACQGLNCNYCPSYCCTKQCHKNRPRNVTVFGHTSTVKNEPLSRASSRDRIVVSTLRCGRSNPGSNPGHGSSCKLYSCSVFDKTYLVLLHHFEEDSWTQSPS